MKPITFLLALLLLSFGAGCKVRKDATSGSKQIFADARRSQVTWDEYPFIIAVDKKRCTGFVIDAKNRIGLTANHCAPTIGTPICLGANNSNWVSATEIPEADQPGDQPVVCPHAGRITNIRGVSLTRDKDVVRFAFELDDGFQPTASLSVNEDTALIGQLARSQSQPIFMVGYPADRVAQGNLTRSDCRVRSDIFPTPADSIIRSTTREVRKSSNITLRKFNIMSKSCSSCFQFFETINHFYTDCSVYGGNSGGPIVFQKTAIGMPSTYYPEPGAADFLSEMNAKRYEECRSEFESNGLTDLWKQVAARCEPKPYKFDDWNTLDRTTLTNRFPQAISSTEWEIKSYTNSEKLQQEICGATRSIAHMNIYCKKYPDSDPAKITHFDATLQAYGKSQPQSIFCKSTLEPNFYATEGVFDAPTLPKVLRGQSVANLNADQTARLLVDLYTNHKNQALLLSSCEVRNSP